MKKILSICLLVSLLCSTLVFTSSCGASKGLEFALSEDGASYVVVGRGTCKDTELVIPKKHKKLPVTAIAEGALMSLSDVTSVTIPGSVKTIGRKAFAYCDLLSELKIENGVESIGEEAFRGCVKLTDIVLPESTVRIDLKAFAYCTDIENFTMQSKTMTFGDRIFENNKKIERILFGGTIEDWKTNVHYVNDKSGQDDSCGDGHDHSHDDGEINTVSWRYTTLIERVHCSDGALSLD